MSYQLVDSVSMTIATVVAAAGEVEGRIWAIFLWDPAQGAYIGQLPSIAQGNKGGARIYTENPSDTVSSRYYIKAVVRDPAGMPVASVSLRAPTLSAAATTHRSRPGLGTSQRYCRRTPA